MPEQNKNNDPILQACKEKGPMDASFLMGTENNNNMDAYYADDLKTSRFVQFSKNSENEDIKGNDEHK